MAIDKISSAGIDTGGVASTNLASGVPTRAQLPAGCVLQVVQAVPDPLQISVTSSGASLTFTPTTSNATLAFSGTITLLSNTSKVLVMVKVNPDSSTNPYEEVCCLFRGTTLLATNNWYRRVSSSEPVTHVINYLDSPATSGAVQYDIRFAAGNASPTISINRAAGGTGGNWQTDSTLVLMEIAA